MTTLQFKTNIKCSGCIAKTTPYLNEAVGESNWNVDVQDPNKVLTVSANPTVNEKTVIQALEKAGYTAEKI
ncbi:heavy-metal-associated domain-containing protein [Flavisolibacter tropicus]|uniref:Heavy metal transport/detoxification protein n=1 Tax=Flavisolibacter tropicus TaxID=1492898 RepID=A0A172TUH1_9BACT|nr:heavy metal transport/detoxification protein [Flavisolibacter tropicus]ANE50735.1 heavy metal transport/detoxification protein [Flavisolibacter tropicus]